MIQAVSFMTLIVKKMTPAILRKTGLAEKIPFGLTVDSESVSDRSLLQDAQSCQEEGK